MSPENAELGEVIVRFIVPLPPPGIESGTWTSLSENPVVFVLTLMISQLVALALGTVSSNSVTALVELL